MWAVETTQNYMHFVPGVTNVWFLTMFDVCSQGEFIKAKFALPENSKKKMFYCNIIAVVSSY